ETDGRIARVDDTRVVASGYQHRAGEAGVTEAVVRRVIVAFYGKVRRDAILGPVFEAIVKDDWPAHIERVCSFWLYVTRLDRSYQARNFMPAHARHPTIQASLLPQWLRLFRETAAAECDVTAAEALIDVAERMADTPRIGLARRDGG